MNEQYGTGAIPNTKDNRDIVYSSLPQAQAPVQIPAEYKTDISMLPVENQGQRGACVIYSLAKQVQYKEYKETGVVVPLSQRFGYTIARAISGAKGSPSEGLMPRYGAKALANGLWDRLALDDVTLPSAEYENMQITETMKQEAYKYRTPKFAFIYDLVTLQKAIMTDGLVSVSLPCDNGNMNTGYLPAPTAFGFRHYVTIYGWYTVLGRIKFLFRNSWSKDWGNNGDGEFYWDEYKNQCWDMIALTDVPDSFIETARATAYQFTTDIAKGTSGPVVLELQKALSDLGYYDGEQTGYYGNMTAQAVTAFQNAQGIKTNQGKNVGPQTRTKLNELLALLKKNPNVYAPVAKMKTSDNGIALIQKFEGCILHPYQDQVGYWTIGWGARYDFAGNEVTKDTPTLTPLQAKQLLQRDIARFEAIVDRDARCTNQDQYDALVSFCYNLGSLYTLGALQRSGQLRRSHFLEYVYARGKKLPVLVQRRGMEADLYFGGQKGGVQSANLVNLNDGVAPNIMLEHLLNDSRFKSLAWRGAMMAIAFLANAMAQNLTALHLSVEVTTFVGLVLGEVSKAVNSYLTANSEATQLG